MKTTHLISAILIMASCLSSCSEPIQRTFWGVTIGESSIEDVKKLVTDKTGYDWNKLWHYTNDIYTIGHDDNYITAQIYDGTQRRGYFHLCDYDWDVVRFDFAYRENGKRLHSITLTLLDNYSTYSRDYLVTIYDDIEEKLSDRYGKPIEWDPCEIIWSSNHMGVRLNYSMDELILEYYAM